MLLAIELNETLMSSRPKNKKPRPTIILPLNLSLRLFKSRITNAPIKISGKQIFDITSIEMIKAKTVVPIWAPIIIGTACFKSSSPALINPTTITVVALDD